MRAALVIVVLIAAGVGGWWLWGDLRAQVDPDWRAGLSCAEAVAGLGGPDRLSRVEVSRVRHGESGVADAIRFAPVVDSDDPETRRLQQRGRDAARALYERLAEDGRLTAHLVRIALTAPAEAGSCLLWGAPDALEARRPDWDLVAGDAMTRNAERYADDLFR